MWIHVSPPCPAGRPVEPPFGASTAYRPPIEAANYAVLDLATWRTAWHSSFPRTSYDIGASYDIDGIRLRDIHCHWDGSFQGRRSRASASVDS
jgi:hypothetical protein